MTGEDAVVELWRRWTLEGPERLMLALAGPRTYDALHDLKPYSLHAQQVMRFLAGLPGLPEGRVLVVTEGTLRASLGDWPARDTVEVDG
jgi:hypothetical protein